MPPTPPLSSTPYQLSDHHRFELYPGDIVETGAAVLLSSTGPSARLTNKISKAIIAASGEQGGKEIRAQVQRLKPIAEGSIAITTAGSISGTRYIFHTVPTRGDRALRRCPTHRQDHPTLHPSGRSAGVALRCHSTAGQRSRSAQKG